MKTIGFTWVLPVLTLSTNVARAFSEDQKMTLPDEQMTTPGAPDRLLMAIEVIARDGPLTADDLRIRLGLPKTVVWRLVKKLREADWVRLRNGGHLIELNARLDELFATAHFADREFSILGDVMVDMAEAGQFHLDLFVPDHTGQVQLLDTSRRLTAARSALDTSDEFIEQVIRVAKMGQDHAVQTTRKHRSSGVDASYPMEDTDQLDSSLIQTGFIWDYDKLGLCVALLGKMGTPAAIRITPKNRTPRPATLCAAFRDLRRELRPYVAEFGKKGHSPSVIDSD